MIFHLPLLSDILLKSFHHFSIVTRYTLVYSTTDRHGDAAQTVCTESGLFLGSTLAQNL